MIRGAVLKAHPLDPSSSHLCGCISASDHFRGLDAPLVSPQTRRETLWTAHLTADNKPFNPEKTAI